MFKVISGFLKLRYILIANWLNMAINIMNNEFFIFFLNAGKQSAIKIYKYSFASPEIQDATWHPSDKREASSLHWQAQHHTQWTMNSQS